MSTAHQRSKGTTITAKLQSASATSFVMALSLSMASLEAPYTALELFAHTCVYNLTAYQNTVLDHAADNAICTMHEPLQSF